MRVCTSHHPNWHNHALENQPSPLSEKGSGAWGFRLFDGRSCGIGRYNILFSLCFHCVFRGLDRVLCSGFLQGGTFWGGCCCNLHHCVIILSVFAAFFSL